MGAVAHRGPVRDDPVAMPPVHDLVKTPARGRDSQPPGDQAAKAGRMRAPTPGRIVRDKGQVRPALADVRIPWRTSRAEMRSPTVVAREAVPVPPEQKLDLVPRIAREPKTVLEPTVVLRSITAPVQITDPRSIIVPVPTTGRESTIARAPTPTLPIAVAIPTSTLAT